MKGGDKYMQLLTEEIKAKLPLLYTVRMRRIRWCGVSSLHRILAGLGMPWSLMGTIRSLDWWMGLKKN